jgi:hypothetical protein
VTMTEVEAPAPPERTPSAAAEVAVRAGGVVVVVLATVVTAVAELYLTPLRVGGVPIGVAIPFAAAANWGLAWFALTTTGRRWAMGLPWALWTVIMLFAAGVRTTEGDYLLGGNDWVALVMILVGSLAFAVYSYRVILRRGKL